jgi:hypothetical protein
MQGFLGRLKTLVRGNRSFSAVAPWFWLGSLNLPHVAAY